METLIKCVYFLLIQAIVLMDSVAADPEIFISPSEIHPGISSALDINCTFSLKNYPGMAAFISLSLSRANTSSQNFEELAVITQFSPDSVNQITQEKVLATGFHSQTEQSFLQITWKYPSDTQAGVYKCAAHGVDMLGHTVELTNASVVTVDKADLNDIFEKLKTMENRMENNEKSMENTITSLKNHVQILENTVTSLTEWRQDTIANQLELIGTYQNREYYLSKAAFRNINESEATCKLFGGTLIEIDDESEYNATMAFLQDAGSAIQFVMIGVTYDSSEGEWILLSTNKTMPFTAWGRYQDASAFGECVALRNAIGYYYGYNMYYSECQYDSPNDNTRGTCEIPFLGSTGQITSV